MICILEAKRTKELSKRKGGGGGDGTRSPPAGQLRCSLAW